MGHVGKTAAIVGAGMAGLPAASVLSQFFERIVMLDTDDLATFGTPRPGTPQSRHLHVLLAGGLQALEELFPELRDALIVAGAQSLGVAEDYRLERPGFGVFPQRSLGVRILSMSRHLLESEVRRRVSAIKNVEIREGCHVTEFTLADDGAVRGVLCRNKAGALEELPADLIVDASGHGQLTLNLVAACGLTAPFEDTVGIDMHYATTTFSGPPRLAEGWRVLVTYPDPPGNRRGAFVLPIEDGKWMVTLIGRHDCKSPADIAGFLDYTRQLPTPTVFDLLQAANLTPFVARHGLRASRWRHFENIEGFPQRLLPFGDTICRFNPIYGQGMTVAAKETCLLRGLLKGVEDGSETLADLPRKFLRQCQSLIDVPWGTAVVPDFIDPLTEGNPPDNIKEALAFQLGIFRLAQEDAAVHKLMVEVQHMLRPRAELLKPDIVERVRSASTGCQLPN